MGGAGKLTIAIRCDTNGLEYKSKIIADFKSHPRVAQVIDLGIKSLLSEKWA